MIPCNGPLAESSSQMTEQFIARAGIAREYDALRRNASATCATRVLERSLEKRQAIALFGRFSKDVEHRFKDLSLSRKEGCLGKSSERTRLELG